MKKTGTCHLYHCLLYTSVNYIELSGEKLPIKCDMVVLEKIQEEYKDLDAFEEKLNGFTPNRNADGEIETNEEGLAIGTFRTPNKMCIRDRVRVAFGEFNVIDVDTLETVDRVVGWHTEVIETDALSKCEPFCLPMPLTDFYIEISEFEVFGNIFDNPELLEVE